MTSFFVRGVCYCRSAGLSSKTCSTHSIAKSMGIDVNRAYTSKETRIKSSGKLTFSNCYFISCVFFNFLMFKFVNGVNILDRNLEVLYIGEPQKDTIGLIGLFSLCVLIKA